MQSIITHGLLTLTAFLAFNYEAQEIVINAPEFRTEKYFKVDTKQSLITWKGTNLFKFNEHTGTVNISKGEIKVTDNKLSGGVIVIDMATIVDSDNIQMLTDHLRSEDFFDVKKYPTSNFKITKVEDGEEPDQYNITGDLTIKAATHPITVSAKVNLASNTFIAECKFIIDRTKWDIRYNSDKFFQDLKDETISDAIQFQMKISAIE